MPRLRRSRFRDGLSLLRSDDGTAAIEFIVGGVLLLVPLLYLIIALGMVQGQTMGVEAAARHLARSLATNQAASASEDLVVIVATQYGVDPDSLSVTLACESSGPCPAPGAILTVTVSAEVTLPLVPPVLGLGDIATVPVSATAVQKVTSWSTP